MPYTNQDLWLTKLPLCLNAVICRHGLLGRRALNVMLQHHCVLLCVIVKDGEGSCGATGSVLMQCMAAVPALSMPLTS